MRPSKALGSAPLALGLLCLVSVTSSALAQRARGEWRMSCRDHEDDDWGETYCDIKEQTLRPGTGPIRVDAHPNGGVAVVGWDKNEILLCSKITAHARSEEDARALAGEVRIQVSGNTISADGPSTHRRQWWSVSFELRVPNHSDLAVRAQNGGIEVEAVRGEMDLETVNGGLTLRSVAGDVRAETTNGGVNVDLEGERWDGRGLDIRTTNGGVRLWVPERYSATLETGTVNGGLEVEFPVRVQGRLTRRITTQLGDGGPTIRALTTNGGVVVRRR